MPCRYIREDFLTSEHVDQLDVNAERFYFRLFLVVDDFGRFEANERILRSKCYPLKENIRTTDIARWLTACEKADLIRLYKRADKVYLSVNRFAQTRANCRSQKSKYPSPDEDLQADDNNLQALANNLQASANNLKAFAADTDTENDTENESDIPHAHAQEQNQINQWEKQYPTCPEDVVKIANQCGKRMTLEQADVYFTWRVSTEWVDASRRKINPGLVAYDLKKWILRDENREREMKSKTTVKDFSNGQAINVDPGKFGKDDGNDF